MKKILLLAMVIELLVKGCSSDIDYKMEDYPAFISFMCFFGFGIIMFPPYLIVKTLEEINSSLDDLRRK